MGESDGLRISKGPAKADEPSVVDGGLAPRGGTDTPDSPPDLPTGDGLGARGDPSTGIRARSSATAPVAAPREVAPPVPVSPPWEPEVTDLAAVISGRMNPLEFLGFTKAELWSSKPPSLVIVQERTRERGARLRRIGNNQDRLEQRYANELLGCKSWKDLQDRLEAGEKGYAELLGALKSQQNEEIRALVRRAVREGHLSLPAYDGLMENLSDALGRPAAAAAIDAVCKELGVVRHEFQPMKQLQAAPTTVAGLHVAILQEWKTVAERFDKEEWAKDLHFMSAPDELVKIAREQQIRWLNVKEPALWQFLWRSGYRGLHLGEPNTPVSATNVAELLKSTDGDAAKIERVLDRSVLEEWLSAVVKDSALSEFTARTHKRVKGDSNLKDCAQRVLWRLGEKRLKIAGMTFASREQFAAVDPNGQLLQEIEADEQRAMIRDWLILGQGLAENDATVVALKAASQSVAKPWAALHALGYRNAHLASADRNRAGTTVIHDFKELVARALHSPTGWEQVAVALDDKLPVWLQFVHGISEEKGGAAHWRTLFDSTKADGAQRSTRIGGGNARRGYRDRAVQELLWDLGDKRLRIDWEGEQLVAASKPSDLIAAVQSGHAGALAGTYDDGSLAAWLTREKKQDVITAAEATTDDPALRLFAVLWQLGWRVLPLDPNLTSGPASVQELINHIDATGKPARDWLVEHWKSGALFAWLQFAQSTSPAVVQALKGKPDVHLAEHILVALGAAQPTLTSTQEGFELPRVQEGSTHRMSLSLRAAGARGYLYGRVNSVDSRLVVHEGEAFRIGPGEQHRVALTLTVPVGKTLVDEALGVSIDCLNGPSTTLAAKVSTIFPKAKVLQAGAIGAGVGLVVLIALRLWLGAFALDGTQMSAVTDFSWIVSKSSSWQLLFLGTLPAILATAIGWWIKERS